MNVNGIIKKYNTVQYRYNLYGCGTAQYRYSPVWQTCPFSLTLGNKV